ncbi:phosphate acetyltransferase [Buchnera aphidicola]|uniref:phosphate acetyltransferase n=1 Tax=Buchnera aphidicola TaxID=9 RepID=UPI003463C997
MSRIIMLIPLNNQVGSTAISLSMLNFFNKNKYRKDMNKPILYISCQSNSLDHTTVLIKKYFSSFVHILNNIDFSNIYFGSDIYISLINTIIEICYKKKKLYELIFIEGLSHEKNLYSYQINHDIANSINAEVVLITNINRYSLNSIQDKEDQIKFFLQQYHYKKFIGVIFNEMNFIYLGKNISFIKKIKFLKKIKEEKKKTIIVKRDIKTSLYPIIAYIPWNQDFMKIFVVDIYHFLNAIPLHIDNINFRIIETVIIFNENNKDILKKINSHILIILPWTQIDIFIIFFSKEYKFNNISAILLTGQCQSIKHSIKICQIFIQNGIPVFFLKKNIIDILYKLQSFYFDLNIKEKKYIFKLQTYMSSFFNVKYLNIIKKKSDTHINLSPREFCYRLKMLSRNSKKRIILPESYEIRILQAASMCYDLDIAQCVLLGDRKKIYNLAKDQGIHLNKNIEIIDPDLIRDKYMARFIEIRQHKSINEDFAYQQLRNNIILATLMVESDEVDGMVSGSINTTASTIRPALQLIKTESVSSLVSSIFFMLLPEKVLIYGDCAINIDPTAEELAAIAIQSSCSAKILGIESRIAMLSYSTGDSGCGRQVDKVRKATDIVRIKRPDLIIDGPIQYDAAVSKEISKLKSPKSSLVGDASIFIFPDLNSGNITYKAVQRSSQLVSIGPMLQGLRKPVNDLSRGSLVEDIIYTIALTSIQAI